MRTDPRIRQSLNRISSSLENASDNARTGCFTFATSYLDPCLAFLSNCLPQRGHHNPHHGGRDREYPFGFYDYSDYSDDERAARGVSGGFLAWGNDELDRLLAGSGAAGSSSSRGGGGGYSTGGGGGGMYYGSAAPSTGGVGKRRVDTSAGADPTVIPTTSMFGFLARFASFRGRGLRYKPSAANLQEHPGRNASLTAVVEEERESIPGRKTPSPGRKRSATGSSGDSAGESLRSRGDLWPSEDDDDAVPIGDDFLTGDVNVNVNVNHQAPHHQDDEALRMEEDLEREREESEIDRKREAARKLAVQRGLSTSPDPNTSPLPPSRTVSKTVSLKSTVTVDTAPRICTPSPPPLPPPPIRREKAVGSNAPPPPPVKEFSKVGGT